MKDTTHSICRFTLIGSALAAALSASGGAQAQNDVANGLIVGEMAGACRIMRQLVLSEEHKRLPGGDAFVFRFLGMEVERLGWTPAEFIERCKTAAAVYADLTAEPTPASGPSIAADAMLAGPATTPSRMIPR